MPNNEEMEFRERLYDYKSPVDEEATWLAVEAVLGKKKKRRGILWWMPLLAIIGVAGLGLWFWTAADGLQTAEYPPTEEAASPNRQPKEGPRTQGAKEVIETAALTPNDALADGQTPPSAFTKVESKEQTLVASGEAGVARIETKQTVSTNPPVAALTDLLIDDAAGKVLAEQTVSSSLAPLSSNIAPAAAAITSGQNLAQSATSQSATRNPQLAITQPTTSNLQLAALPWPAFSSVERDLPEAGKIVYGTTFGEAPHSPWSLSLEGSLSLISQQTAGRFETDTLGEPILPQGNVRPLEAITTDLLLGYQTRSGWHIRSGVSFTRINSVSELITESANDNVRTEGITEIIVNGQDSTFVTGLVTGFERTIRTQRYYNHLTLINVPVLFGKDFSLNRWRFSLEAGPVFNIRSSGSARYPLFDGEFSPRDESNDIFRPSLGVSLRAGLSTGFRLTKNLEVHGGLRYHGLPTSGVERSEYPVKTRYDLFGATLGIRIKL